MFSKLIPKKEKKTVTKLQAFYMCESWLNIIRNELVTSSPSKYFKFVSGISIKLNFINATDPKLPTAKLTTVQDIFFF